MTSNRLQYEEQYIVFILVNITIGILLQMACHATALWANTRVKREYKSVPCYSRLIN